MYVCVCKGVTEKQIQRAVNAGADSLRAVRLQLGVASQCGRCADCACKTIEDTLSQNTGSFGGASIVAFAAPKTTP